MKLYGSLCARCKGRLFCGRNRCPILEKARVLANIKKKIEKKEFFGATPPSAFVGRYNYPKVFTGALVPPEISDTKIYDSPAQWFERGFEIPEILRYRGSLVNSRIQINVKSAPQPDRTLRTIQELSMSSRPVDIEVALKKSPKIRMTFNLVAAPYGPSGELKQVELAENVKIKRKIEYVVSDDLNANQAIFKLYNSGVDVYQLSRMLSVGLFGIKKQRRLVPTRWSITGIDSIVANSLLQEVKDFEPVNKYLLFESHYLKNYFEIVLLPIKWQFEQIEMFTPGGMWTQKAKKPVVISDYEGYFGRKEYAETVAGAYYSSKLAVLEYLRKIKRQAGVLVIREIRPIYPPVSVGVWKIRETVRAAMKGKYKEFEDIRAVIQEIDQKLKISSKFWAPKSKIIQKELYQRTIKEYLRFYSP